MFEDGNPSASEVPPEDPSWADVPLSSEGVVLDGDEGEGRISSAAVQQSQVLQQSPPNAESVTQQESAVALEDDVSGAVALEDDVSAAAAEAGVSDEQVAEVKQEESNENNNRTPVKLEVCDVFLMECVCRLTPSFSSVVETSGATASQLSSASVQLQETRALATDVRRQRPSHPRRASHDEDRTLAGRRTHFRVRVSDVTGHCRGADRYSDDE